MQLYRISGMDLSTFELNRAGIIENYDSLIWTNRYSACGDFELTLPITSFVAPNTSINAIQSSLDNNIMMVENADIVEDEDSGSYKVKLSGRSIEAFFENRNSLMINSRDNQIMTGLPSQIIYDLVDEYCLSGTTVGNQFPGLVISGTNPSGQTSVELSITRGDLYTIIKDICDTYDLGFKIDPSVENNNMTFTVYRGSDMTSGSEYTEYSRDNETLRNVKSFVSNKGYKTHLRVLGATTGVTKYRTSESANRGYRRRTLVVDATDVNADGSMATIEEQDALQIRGDLAFKKIENRFTRIVDGQGVGPIYGLGDLVVLKSIDSTGADVKSNARIVESILTSDGNTDNYYPSFEPV